MYFYFNFNFFLYYNAKIIVICYSFYIAYDQTTTNPTVQNAEEVLNLIPSATTIYNDNDVKIGPSALYHIQGMAYWKNWRLFCHNGEFSGNLGFIYFVNNFTKYEYKAPFIIYNCF